MWKALAEDYDAYSPALGKHEHGGNRKLPDVCQQCNTGPLRDLDEIARKWWVARGASRIPVLEAPPPEFGRWLAKIAFNTQRCELTAKPLTTCEPLFPEAVKSWILGRSAVPSEIAICGAALASDYFPRKPATVYGSLGWKYGVRTIHLRGLVFAVAWSHPMDPRCRPIRELVLDITNSLPAIPLDLVAGTPPFPLPVVSDPSVLGLD